MLSNAQRLNPSLVNDDTNCKEGSPRLVEKTVIRGHGDKGLRDGSVFIGRIKARQSERKGVSGDFLLGKAEFLVRASLPPTWLKTPVI